MLAQPCGNLDAIKDYSRNSANFGTDKYVDIDWQNIDKNSSKLRFIFAQHSDTDGPITLSSTNWQNVKNAPEVDFKKFGKVRLRLFLQ